MDGSLDALRAGLESAGLAHHADALLALARPSIRLGSSPVASEDEIAIGASKLGGRPDVPAGFVWPRHHGVPLAFVAQIDLATVTAFDPERLLPEAGLLSFFIHPNEYGGAEDPDERTDWRLMHLESDAPLVRQERPDDDLPDDDWWEGKTRYAATPLLPGPVYSLPPLDSAEGKDIQLDDSSQDAELWLYLELRWEDPPAHKLLGYPRQSQGDIQLWCQVESHGLDWRTDGAPNPEVAEVGLEAGRWRLLLQVDSDRHAGMSWCGDDTLYYMIREEDLRARRWDQTWVVIECS
jgi:uncharacterized protein YwqG